MSWAEVKKINSNMVVPLNRQLRNMELYQSWWFNNSSTFTPPVTGIYKIMCIGAGGDAKSASSGGAGGVVIGLYELTASTSYDITILKNASFANLITATAGANGTYSSNGAGGGGEGGTVYQGNPGKSGGGSVGIYIPGAMKEAAVAEYPGGTGLYMGHSEVKTGSDSGGYRVYTASSAGGCGAGGGGYYGNANNKSYLETSGGKAAVLITLIEEGGEL